MQSEWNFKPKISAFHTAPQFPESKIQFPTRPIKKPHALCLRLTPRSPRLGQGSLRTYAHWTYGAEMLTNTSLGYALRLVARRGGVAFVQRVLWGESASDAQLSVMLMGARAAFTKISHAFPDVFLADANAVLVGFMSRPPGPPTSKNGGNRE